MVASPLRPHFGQIKVSLAWLVICAVSAGGFLRGCPKFAHVVVNMCLEVHILAKPDHAQDADRQFDACGGLTP